MGWRSFFGMEERAIEPPQAAWMRLISGWENPTASATPDQALSATPVLCAVDFLSSAMASLGRIIEERDGKKWKRLDGSKLDNLLNGAVNDEWDADRWIKYSFWQTLTSGRQFTWIERPNGQILNLWPLEPAKVTASRSDGQTVYKYSENGRNVIYPAADIIDVPFALEPDQFTHISPLKKGENAIGLLLAMEKYASSFFAGGGVLPLAVTGPQATGPEAQKRMVTDINRAIKQAKEDGKQIFPLPPGYTISPVGFDPQKGQMTEARRFQVEEIARIYRLPPWFLQDLTQANFANSENQDLHLVKHTLAHWANAWESQMNLKIFGRRVNNRRVRLNMDSLLRGDFQTRADAIAKLVQAAVYTPNDGRGYMGLEKFDDPNADKLHIQGATVPLNQSGQNPANGDNLNG